MNPIFTELLKLEVSIRPFLEWYMRKYPNMLPVFQTLPFSHQIGVYLEYFESIYNLVVLVNTRGFTVHFTDNRSIQISKNSLENYYHYKFLHNEPKSIIHGYELGIIWLFKNYDLPF